MLEQDSRHLPLTMPVAPNATFTQLNNASGLEAGALQSTLIQLRALSLVEIGGDLSEPCYRLHRLTDISNNLRASEFCVPFQNTL